MDPRVEKAVSKSSKDLSGLILLNLRALTLFSVFLTSCYRPLTGIISVMVFLSLAGARNNCIFILNALNSLHVCLTFGTKGKKERASCRHFVVIEADLFKVLVMLPAISVLWFYFLVVKKWRNYF